MSRRRSKNRALKLTGMPNIDGKLGRPRHLVAGLQTRENEGIVIETAGAGLGYGLKDAVIGAAAAQMAR